MTAVQTYVREGTDGGKAKCRHSLGELNRVSVLWAFSFPEPAVSQYSYISSFWNSQSIRQVQTCTSQDCEWFQVFLCLGMLNHKR